MVEIWLNSGSVEVRLKINVDLKLNVDLVPAGVKRDNQTFKLRQHKLSTTQQIDDFK